MRFQLTLTQYLIGIFFVICLFSSCKKNLEEERTIQENRSIESFIAANKWTNYNKVDGLYHVIRTSSYGYQVLIGDTVEFNYKGYTLDGKVFDTNVKSIAKAAKLDTTIRSFNPIVTIVGRGKLIDGLDEGLQQVREGEFATILFSSSYGYGSQAIGSIKPWSPVAYDLLEIIRVNSPSIQKERDFIKSLNLAANGFSEDKSGLFYKKILLGSGSTPTINDTIYGWYKGTLPNGTVIDEMDTENKQIILSAENVPLGVKLGFLLTSKAGVTDLVLPSYLGFGNNGNKLVEPYQTLNYRIRLDSIK